MDDNKDSLWVIYSQIVFGLRKNPQEDYYKTLYKECIYYATLVSCIMLA